MAVYINELGEFSIPEAFDPDANRNNAYKGCIGVDMDRIRMNSLREEQRILDCEDIEMAECPCCHREYPKRHKSQIYCSVKCQRRSYNRARRAEHAAKKAAKPKEKCECPYCHEMFEPKRRGQKFCGDECREAHRNKCRREMRR